MIVSELIQALESLPQDYEVILSKDAEGNGFSPFADASSGVYEPNSRYSGEFHPNNQGENPNAVVLWPVN